MAVSEKTTLTKLARAFYEERGTYMSPLGTPDGDKAYLLWAEWAVSTIETEAQAMKEKEAWEAKAGR